MSKCLRCGRSASLLDQFVDGKCNSCYHDLQQAVMRLARLGKPENKPMKKYRCKIDSPFGKKGDILAKKIYCGFKRAEDTMPAIVEYTPDVLPEMFEEIPNRWVPEEDDTFYSIDLQTNRGGIDEFEGWNPERSSFHQIIFKHNNVFRTKEKAEEVLKKILQVLEEEKEV